jgi:glycosyltransferase involved in cell wall biosynthesis
VRILVASGPFPPDPGGPSTHLAHLVPALVARGHHMRAVAYGEVPDVSVPCQVTRVPLGPLPIRQARYALALRRAAAGADVIYQASLGLPFAASRPVVLRVPGDRAWERAVNRRLVPPSEDIDAFQTRRYGVRVRLLQASRTREARRARRIVVPSRYVGDLVAGWGVDTARVRVVPSALPVPGPPVQTPAEARASLGWGPADHCLLVVARLTAWKGVDLVIDAAARHGGVRLVVVGDGPERAALEGRARDAGAGVVFTGALPREAIAPFLRAADYLVLYSGYEGLSHAIIEALHAGTPVIASARGGNPELVRDGVNGLLVRHPDPQALDAALARALAPGARAMLSAGARQAPDARAWPAAVDAIEAELEAAAGGT